jgi:hypothetical protein
MKSYKLAVVLTFSFFLFGCQQRWENALNNVDKSLLYGNDRKGWQLVQEIKNEWDTYYTIEKIDNDTSKVLFFLQANGDGTTNVSGYRKIFKCNKTDTCYLKMSSQDTLFFYRENNHQKIFEVGEYAYHHSYFKMDSIEVKYYLEHEDSLRRVRGNNLPRLPNEFK